MFGGYVTANSRYQEILRLRKMLREANIPHAFDRIFDGWIVCYPTAEERVMDAIEHRGSYGNFEDKLEIFGLLTPEEASEGDVLGHLTAEEVFERIRKHHDGEWDEYIDVISVVAPEETHEETHEETPTNTPMTPEEFATQMRDLYRVHIEKNDDEELAHGCMDDAMCDLLCQLGYGEGVDIFMKTPKWYA